MFTCSLWNSSSDNCEAIFRYTTHFFSPLHSHTGTVPAIDPWPPLCNFNGHERNVHQRHHTAEIIELIARTSIVRPTGVSNCGSHMHRSSSPSPVSCFTLAMTSKLVVIINSLKVSKIKKVLLYEMKFLVPNYGCLQKPWLGGYRPQIPVLSVSVLNWICWTPRTKLHGTPLTETINEGDKIIRNEYENRILILPLRDWWGIGSYGLLGCIAGQLFPEMSKECIVSIFKVVGPWLDSYSWRRKPYVFPKRREEIV